MIKFYGIFQLVKINKEDKTKKGDTMVYFTAASNRGEDKTDFKFFKMYGQNADFLLRNLQKDDKGKYKSRKMMIEGYVETYMDNQEVECTANLKKDKVPEQAGFLKVDLKIKAKTTVQVQRDTYVVNHFEFVDKKKEMDVEVLINDEIEFEYNDDDEVAISDNNKQVKTSSEVKREAKSVSNGLNDAFKSLDNLKMIDDMN